LLKESIRGVEMKLITFLTMTFYGGERSALPSEKIPPILIAYEAGCRRSCLLGVESRPSTL
jgi:hypothetical protein